MKKPFAVLVAAVLLGALAASAQVGPPPPPPPPPPALALSPDVGPAGTVGTASGSGFSAGGSVSLHWGGPSGAVIGGPVTVDATGAFSTSFSVPATAAPGQHTVSACVPSSATGNLCQERADDQFLIPAPTTTTAPSTTTTSTTTTTTAPTTTTTSRPTTTTTAPTTTSSEPVSETTTTTFGVTDTTVGGDPLPPPSLKIPPGEPPGDIEAPDIPFPNIGIKALEVTQGMQDLDNTMPLAAERRTVVRLHVYVAGDPWPNGMAALRAFRGGEEMPTVYPVNGPITIQPQGGSRVKLDDSFWFEVPHEWTEEGEVLFEAQVWSYQPSTIWDNEPLAFDNFKKVEVTFEKASTKTVRFVPIHYHDGGGGGPTITYYATSGGNVKIPVWNTVKSLYRLHPLAGLNFLYQDSAVAAWNHCCIGGEWDLDDSGDGSKVLSRLETVKWPGAKNELWVGMFHPSVTGGGGSGLGRIDAKVSWVKMNDSASDWAHTAGETFAHEIGHNAGFYHAECTGTEDLVKPHPFDSPCRLAKTDPEGFYGFDVYWDMFGWVDGPTALSNDPGESDPNVAFPLMGYKNPGYPDAWTWCVLLDWYGVDCDVDTIVPAPPSGGGNGGGGPGGVDTENVCKPCVDGEGLCPPKGTSGGMKLDLCISSGEEEEFSLIPQDFDQVLGVGGDLNDGELFGVVLLPPDMGDALEAWGDQLADVGLGASAGTVQVIDAEGSVITSVPVRHKDTHHEPEDTGAFLVWVPWAGEGALLRVQTAAGIVSERAISANPPVVAISSPASGQSLAVPFDVAWSASDSDGDSLLFDLYYSIDGGAKWFNIASGLEDTNTTVDSLAGFGGGEAVLLRVVASDGVLTGFDTAGPFSTPDQPPALLVIGPDNGSIYPDGYPIRLEALAADPEGGVVSVRWTSDRDGAFLEGAIGQTADLSVGRHQLTVSASDDEGAVTTAQIIVEIAPSNRSEIFTAAALVEARANFERARTEAGGQLPDSPAGSDEEGALPWIPLGVGAVLLMAVGVLVGRRLGTGAGGAAQE